MTTDQSEDDGDAPARAHILVSGRVQGVWFRKATREEAKNLGLLGWVRNLADGRVEAVAEGRRRAVEALLVFCRRGPPHARVEHVEVTWDAASGEFGAFEIESNRWLAPMLVT